MKDNRYQYQKWYIKLWRRRHYLLIPFTVFNIWRAGEPWEFAWGVAIGIAQCNMNWVHDWDEVAERLNKKLLEIRKENKNGKDPIKDREQRPGNDPDHTLLAGADCGARYIQYHSR